MMTLDEAIKHCEDNAKRLCKLFVEQFDKEGNLQTIHCSEEHEQLANWLKDYKRLKEKYEPDIKEYHGLYEGSQYAILSDTTNLINLQVTFSELVNIRARIDDINIPQSLRDKLSNIKEAYEEKYLERNPIKECY